MNNLRPYAMRIHMAFLTKWVEYYLHKTEKNPKFVAALLQLHWQNFWQKKLQLQFYWIYPCTVWLYALPLFGSSSLEFHHLKCICLVGSSRVCSWFCWIQKSYPLFKRSKNITAFRNCIRRRATLFIPTFYSVFFRCRFSFYHNFFRFVSLGHTYSTNPSNTLRYMRRVCSLVRLSAQRHSTLYFIFF